MAKFTSYFGNNSNGPEKKLGNTWLTGISLQPFGKKGNKTSYSAKGKFKNKTYIVSYKGKKFKYTSHGHIDGGHINSLKLYENKKLKQNWEISYEISTRIYYFTSFCSVCLHAFRLFL